jgi:dienelactone hydrolase
MKYINLFFALAMLTVLSCDDKDESVIQNSTANPDNSIADPTDSIADPIVPAWSTGFPAITNGATSADIKLETNKRSTIYYIITDQETTFSPEELIAEASSPSRPSIIHHGIEALGEKEPQVKSIQKLKERKKYFGYFVAASDDEPVATQEVQSLSFTTKIRQDTAQFTSTHEKRNVDYLLYQPEEVFKNPDKKYPIIFFLGGLGERAHGSKRINVIQNGLLPEYIHKGNDVPMIVMSVQHITDSWNPELVNEAMDYAFANLPVDKSRVYLVGTSAGAFGVWEFAQKHPERLTAIVPISGGGNKEQACNLSDLAIWAFTNKADRLVSPGLTVSMVNAVNKCHPKKEAKLKVFPDAGHDCWRRVFDQKHPDWSKSPNEAKVDIFQWLLEQKRATAN